MLHRQRASPKWLDALVVMLHVFLAAHLSRFGAGFLPDFYWYEF
jgi:hypothetical protein